MLKRKEREYEQETQKLVQDKIKAQERIIQLKRDLAAMNIDIDLKHFVEAVQNEDDDTRSASTDTG